MKYGLIGLLVVGLSMYAYGSYKYFVGHSEGESVGITKERLAQQKILDNLRANQRKELDRINAEVEAQNEVWRLKELGARREQEKDRALNEARTAAFAAERNSMRDYITRAVTGGVQAADDTLDASRERAISCGRVLEEVLSATEQCTAESEGLGSSIRTLQSSWPTKGQ